MSNAFEKATSELVKKALDEIHIELEKKLKIRETKLWKVLNEK